MEESGGGRTIKNLLIAVFGLLCFSSGYAEQDAAGFSNRPLVEVAQIDGFLNSAKADFLESVVEKAANDNAALLIIKLDTHGGPRSVMQRGVDALTRSRVPVAVWSFGSGTQASGTGAFWMLAADWAIMAPGSSLGARHNGEAKQINEDELKMASEAVGLLRGLVSHRGASAVGWAESMVWQSDWLTAEAAYRMGIADAICADLDMVLRDMEGREAILGDGSRVILHLKGAQVVDMGTNTNNLLFSLVSDPNIAYILLLLGLILLMVELFHPGGILPGVLGFILAAGGLIGLGALPLNPAGLALIILAMVLFFLEIKFTSWGLLAVGGMICMITGSLILIDTSAAGYVSLNLPLVIGASAMMLAFFLFIVAKGLRIQSRKPLTGMDGMLGELGRTTSRVTRCEGRGMVRGEYWYMICSEAEIEAGCEIEVVGIENMLLIVKPKG